MRILVAMLITLLFAGGARALEVAGVSIPPVVTVDHHQLMLNGSGIRKKFFFKIYIGSLYAARRLSSTTEALADKGDKLIRMNFLYSKVEKEKIVEAFQEGFARNSPALSGSADVKRFLSLFTDDFRRGDTVDLFLGGKGSVTVKHNGRVLGSMVSPQLTEGILRIYLGDHPADEDMKRGMLGKE